MVDILIKIIWGAFVLFSVYQTFSFVIRKFRFNLFFGSWYDLQRIYLLKDAPKSIRLVSTSARIGMAEYVDTIAIGIGEEGVYFQRDFFLYSKNILHIPFDKFVFVEKVQSSWLGTGHIIFTVNGIDVWVMQPYADRILQKIGK